MTLVNPLIRASLQNLEYQKIAEDDIIFDIENYGYIKPQNKYFKKEHRAIFDCSAAPPGYDRVIPYMGHIKMMEAVQPFVSGSISKTVNMPEGTTVEEIRNVYMYAWKHGLKSITIFRDNSKSGQVLTTSLETKETIRCVEREIPPKDRNAQIHKFRIGQTKGYLICGFYPDGRLCEVFVDVAKEGSTLSGLLDTISIQLSIALQHGVPLKDVVRKLMYQNFEPHG